jgi:D-2-hydroxyacid dehydrogenase (NADP+)
MPRLLILLTLPPDVIEQYRATISAKFPSLTIDVANQQSNFEPLVASADILLTFGQVMKNLKADFKNAAKLKWVQALGTGLDGITDQPTLKPDVIVSNVHGIHGAPVSEAALAGMLALGRDIPRVVRSQDQNAWVRWPARLLDGKIVGILGIGAIAEILAPKCKALGMKVIGISSGVRDVPGFDRIYKREDLLRAVPEFDFFVLLTPYSPETHMMINTKVFTAMKTGSYLVNLARGGIVDEDALVEALRSGKLAGAALDVFQQEPLPANHPLWSFRNVIITTHQGGFCDAYVDLAMPTIEHNMRAFLAGEHAKMINVVVRNG